MENVTNIVYLVTVIMSGLSVFLSIITLIKKRKNATTTEEQDQIDELIENQLLIAAEKIQGICKEHGYNCSCKKLSKMATAAIKEASENEQTKNE
jgi:hypothetical protein